MRTLGAQEQRQLTEGRGKRDLAAEHGLTERAARHQRADVQRLVVETDGGRAVLVARDRDR